MKRSFAAGLRNHQGRKGHFGNVEVGIVQLPPEDIAGISCAGDEVDPFRLYPSFQEWPCARVSAKQMLTSIFFLTRPLPLSYNRRICHQSLF